MQTLRSIVEDNTTRTGRVFDLGIQLLIVYSLITFSIETVPGLSPETSSFLQRSEVVVVAIFTIEYLLRVLVATNRLGFVFSFFGLIDLCAILPFYLSTGLDLRSLRSLRFLRLFRLLKLVRYSVAIRRLHHAFLLAKEEVVMFLGVTLILLFLAATGIYYFEHEAQPAKFASVPHRKFP